MNAPAIIWFLAPVCGLLAALLAGLAWLVAWLEQREGYWGDTEHYHSE